MRGLYALANLQVIEEPLTDTNLEFLKSLEKIWSNHEILRLQMTAMNPLRRENLINTADLPDNWMRHIQTQFLNQKLDPLKEAKDIRNITVIKATAKHYPSFKKLFDYNPTYVKKEVTRLRRRAAYFARRFEETKDKTRKDACPECGRGFYNVEGNTL